MVDRLVFTAALLASRVILFNVPVNCEPPKKNYTEMREEEEPQGNQLHVLFQNGGRKQVSFRVLRRRMPHEKLFGPKSLLGIDTIQLQPMQSKLIAYGLTDKEYIEVALGKRVLRQCARRAPGLVYIGMKNINEPELQAFRAKVSARYGYNFEEGKE